MSEYRFVPPRFAFWYLGLSIGIPALIYGLKMTTGLDLSSGGVSIIPIMLASMNEGTQFARATGKSPQGGQAWKLSALFGTFGAMLSMLLAAMIMVSAPQLLGWQGRPSLGFIVIFAGAMIAIYTLIARVFLGLGARSEVKRQSFDDTPE